MILLRANSLLGPLEGMGPEDQDFVGPWNGHKQSKCRLGPPLPMALEMDVAHIKIICPAPYKQQVH